MALTLNKSINEYNAESWFSFVKSLYKAKEGTNNTSVNGIYISFLPNKTIIRVKRTPKVITQKELEKIALEFNKDFNELYALFKKRKIAIQE